MTFRAMSFKCVEKSSDAYAWCEACPWRVPKDKAAKVCKEARRHTEGTGHETRINITRQRGYKKHPTQEP